jgi:hypothetical protein
MTAFESHDRDEEIEGSSDRVFGLVFAAFFLITACLPLFSGGALRVWALMAGGVFLSLALFAPHTLTRLNRLWMRFGLLLGKIVSPIALGLLFLTVITPIGWALRLMGKDSMRLKPDPTADSYWIARNPPGPDPKTMNRQF